jgi:uncharacterized surface anchored protein
MKVLPNWKKTWSAFLTIVLLALSVSAPALASPEIDLGRPGSITITISAGDGGAGSSLSGIQFTAYRVAGVSGSGNYSLTDDFSGSGLRLDKLSTACEASAAAKSLANYASAEKISGISGVTDSGGTVRFRNLSLGYYLVVQTYNPANPHTGRICSPLLTPVPMKSGSGSGWVYDIVTDSKSESACGAVILKKVDGAGNLLSGAVFRLEQKIYAADWARMPSGVQTGSDSSGFYYWSAMISALTTNRYGQAAVTGLPYGEYRFVETAAPAGYTLDSTPHGFFISAYGLAALVNGRYAPSSGSVQTVSVLNARRPPDSQRPGFNFPKTGGSIFYAVCIYGGIVLILCGAAVFAASRKKKR